jgi:hypothetical protein
MLRIRTTKATSKSLADCWRILTWAAKNYKKWSRANARRLSDASDTSSAKLAEYIYNYREGGKYINKFSKTIKPQSDSMEITDFESKVVHETSGTTMFMESAPLVKGMSSKPTMSMSTYVEQENDIKAFLRKPQLLASGAWTEGTLANGNLLTYSISNQLLANTIWANKVQGFNLIKGDFIVRVEINASPFQQGKLLLHYLPCFNNFTAINPHFEGRTNLNLVQKVQHPHLELDCRDGSIAMRIPYVAPSHYFGFRENAYDWGTFFLDVFSPLATGSAAPAGQLIVDYLVYGYFENVELIAPIVPQSGRRELRVVPEMKENQGPIESGLRKVGKTANVAGEIPFLSEFTKPVEWAADIGARIASIWGWSKPRELDGVEVMSEQLFRYAGTADGPDLATPGGVICNNRVETIDYGSYTDVDEMSMGFLREIPYYDGIFTWASGVGQNYNLYNKLIGPQYFVTTATDTVGSHTASYALYSPIGYLAQYFNFWRGSIKVTFKFIKTQMHSGKLQVTWTPCTSVDVVPTATNSTYAMRTIIDIKTENEVTLELPYLVYTDYLNTTAPPSYSGRLDVVVLNDLRGPESVSQSIVCQVFYQGGDDFELAVPQANPSGIYPFIPQSSEEEWVSVTPQSDKTEILQGKESGMTLGDEVVGGLSLTHRPTFHSSRCIGEKVMSIKPLLLRGSVIANNSGGALSGKFITFLPHALQAFQLTPSTGVLASAGSGGDALSILAPMYAFMRGSVRLSLMNQESASVSPVIQYGNYPYTTSTGTVTPLSVGNTISNINLVGTQTNIGNFGQTLYPFEPVTEMTCTKGVAYQHIPYYNRFPFTLTTQFNGIDKPNTDPTYPAGQFVALCNNTADSGFGSFVLQRSVGDDFQLSFFIGCPPVFTSYA